MACVNLGVIFEPDGNGRLSKKHGACRGHLAPGQQVSLFAFRGGTTICKIWNVVLFSAQLCLHFH